MEEASSGTTRALTTQPAASPSSTAASTTPTSSAARERAWAPGSIPRARSTATSGRRADTRVAATAAMPVRASSTAPAEATQKTRRAALVASVTVTPPGPVTARSSGWSRSAPTASCAGTAGVAHTWVGHGRVAWVVASRVPSAVLSTSAACGWVRPGTAGTRSVSTAGRRWPDMVSSRVSPTVRPAASAASGVRATGTRGPPVASSSSVPEVPVTGTAPPRCGGRTYSAPGEMVKAVPAIGSPLGGPIRMVQVAPSVSRIGSIGT